MTVTVTVTVTNIDFISWVPLAVLVISRWEGPYDDAKGAKYLASMGETESEKVPVAKVDRV